MKKTKWLTSVALSFSLLSAVMAPAHAYEAKNSDLPEVISNVVSVDEDINSQEIYASLSPEAK